MKRLLLAALIFGSALFPAPAAGWAQWGSREWYPGIASWPRVIVCNAASVPTGWRNAIQYGSRFWNSRGQSPNWYYTPLTDNGGVCSSGGAGTQWNLQFKYADYGDTACQTRAVTVTANTTLYAHATVTINSRCNWSNYNWTTSLPTVYQYDGMTLAAHEAGHALGLDHAGSSTLMSVSGPLGVRRYPTQDDIYGIQGIY